MDWNEVTRIQVEGKILLIKDAMIMLGEDEQYPDWPNVHCEPGEYVFEINVPSPFHAHRARIRKTGSDPETGEEIGSVDIDNAFIGIIDYETFLDAVQKSYEDYGEWTAMELDDELSLNFSGEIYFNEAKLLYVRSGDGDGTYPCFELIQNGTRVGIECVFKP